MYDRDPFIALYKNHCYQTGLRAIIKFLYFPIHWKRTCKDARKELSNSEFETFMKFFFLTLWKIFETKPSSILIVSIEKAFKGNLHQF